MSKDPYDPKSRYKLVNELIGAARQNGDYYNADMDTQKAEDEAVRRVDNMIRKLRTRK